MAASPSKVSAFTPTVEPKRIETDPAAPWWIGYCRVSTVEQRRGKTVLDQLYWVEEAAQERGINVALWVDDGLSGSTNARPGLQSAYAALLGGGYVGLLALHVDRIARSDDLAGWAELLDPLRAAGLPVVTDYAGYDPSTDEGWERLVDDAIEASKDRRRVRRRLGRGQRRAIREGRKPFGTDPHGIRYDRQTKTFSLVEEEVEATRRAAALVVAGSSLRRATDTLNAEGLLPRGGKPWHPGNVGALLRSRHLIGEWHFSSLGAFVPVPAQLDRETWERVQARLDANGPDTKAPPTKLPSLWRKRLICGDCGRSVYVHTSVAKGRRTMHYRCSSKHRRNREEGAQPCSLPMFRVEEIDTVTWEAVAKVIRSDESLQPEVEAPEGQRAALEGQVEDAGARLADLRRREEGLTRQFEAGRLSEEGYAGALDRLARARRLATGSLQEAEQALADLAAAGEAVQAARDGLAELGQRLDDLTADDRQRVVRALCPLRGQHGLVLRPSGEHEIRGLWQAFAPTVNSDTDRSGRRRSCRPR